MITLATSGAPFDVGADLIGRVTTRPIPREQRADSVRVVRASEPAEDLSEYLAVIAETAGFRQSGVPVVEGCRIDHLGDHDIVLINRRGYVRTVIRHGSSSNSLFATDRCNSLCLMCSQPPREVDDTGKVAELTRIVSLMDVHTPALGISGGEPTLLGAGLLTVIEACRGHLPNTSLHLLSNGRRFLSTEYSRALAQVAHPDLMVGIPLYADIDSLHDYVVQAKGAFNETVIGLQNLGEMQVPVEIRIVIQRHTAKRLTELANFIYRNFTFASHVAFMGLEVVGFAKGNLDDLWIAPEEYGARLEEAVSHLAVGGMNVSIYNHQLCRVPPSLWAFCRQSISDWKQEYSPECNPCVMKDQCGGFFAWNLGHPVAGKVFPISAAPR